VTGAAPNGARPPAGSAWRGYRRALRAVALGEGRAYGFALVVWTVGAILGHQHGAPGVGEALAFLGGALAGVAVTIAVAFADAPTVHAGTRQLRVGVGLLHLVSVTAGVAVGAAIGAAVPGRSSFFPASLGAVLVYQLALAIEVALTSRRDHSERSEEGEPAPWHRPLG
jgi:hypothetical protein